MVPEPERIERAAELLRGEIDRLLEQGREVYRELQDVDAEQPPNASALEYLAQHRLAELEQRMLIAQCELVSTNDPRWHAAQRTSSELRERILSGPLRARERTHARERLKVRQREEEAA